MSNPITNHHIHTFTSDCAPKTFLRIITSSFVRKNPKMVMGVLQFKHTRNLLSFLEKSKKNKPLNRRSNIDKYISFLNIGMKNNQIEIFRMAKQASELVDAETKLIGLTLNMDHMDDHEKPVKNFNTQLFEAKKIKKTYPDNYFPFVSIDPRARSGKSLQIWAKKFFENGIRSKTSGTVYPYFSGIKLYPALGFFPFDPRLDELYAYAEKKGIPIMSHCTRVGSMYIGKKIEVLIPKKPAMLLLNDDTESLTAQKEIYERIDRYYQQGWIKNSNCGNNDIACDLFGHPQNYIPVMRKFPKLKICLAHMGGTDEMSYMKEAQQKTMKTNTEQYKIWKVDRYNWADLLLNLMKKYPHLYSDVSYSVAEINSGNTLNLMLEWFETLDDEGKKIGYRILFGTDFYMTERETREAELYTMAKEKFGDWYEKLAVENSRSYIY